MKFVDPTGMEFNLSEMTDEEREDYERRVKSQRESSILFDVLYSILERSKNVYSVSFEENKTDKPKTGEFEQNSKGGSVTFFTESKQLTGPLLSEELFHAFQNENNSSYSKGEFNKEFEARVFSTMVGAEYPGGGASSYGMNDFQLRIQEGRYGNKYQVITPEASRSINFLIDYNISANKYAKYNINNNIGNNDYRKATTILPFSLQRIITEAYKQNE